MQFLYRTPRTTVNGGLKINVNVNNSIMLCSRWRQSQYLINSRSYIILYIPVFDNNKSTSQHVDRWSVDKLQRVGRPHRFRLSIERVLIGANQSPHQDSEDRSRRGGVK